MHFARLRMTWALNAYLVAAMDTTVYALASCAGQGLARIEAQALFASLPRRGR